MKKTFTHVISILFLLILPYCVLAQWGLNRNITPGSINAVMNENSGTCLVVEGDTVHVIYSDHRTLGYAIYYMNSIDAGTTWNNPIAITDTAATATMPVVAVQGLSVHAVWMDYLNGRRASFYRRSLDLGTTWGTTICLDTNTAFWPGIAAAGSMVVATLNKKLAADTTNTEVFVMVSMDNGTSWGSEQQISYGILRSEDPAIAVQNSDIHLSWNDSRIDTMQIWYCHSPDAGMTWEPETRISVSHSYTSMVCLDDSHVDVAYGNYPTGIFNVWYRNSDDKGATWNPNKGITNNNPNGPYPFMCRKDANMHVVYRGIGANPGAWYLNSTDSGATWTVPVLLGHGGQPYIGYSDCMLHAVWPDSGHIRYRNNPTGNCIAAGITHYENANELSVYPNPSHNTITVKSSAILCLMTIYNALGEIVYEKTVNRKEQEIDLSREAAGIYMLIVEGKHLKIVKE